MNSFEKKDLISNVNGYFYLIQLEPDLDPGRFKVGFATSLEDRIRQHKCSAPLLKLKKHWACKSLWEKTIIDCITNDCEKIHTEVFRSTSIDIVIKKCDEFFDIMPKL
ncbi:MAG: GIY-YIG nuclease family protein [Candidatus Cloacimonetes bacterium]|nr:GIY-YIG nuclease family protein [Candidatus Cloacimonadota bacterium]